MAYTHIAANSTLQVTAASCRLKSVTINTKGSSSNTLTLVEGVIANVNTAPVIAVIDTTSSVVTLEFGTLVQAITAILGTGTAADVTITTE